MIESFVACDVTLRNLIPSNVRKLKLVKSSPYIANPGNVFGA
nr:MAG TPA: hypothetical protein [Caudoviricetes sp.]